MARIPITDVGAVGIIRDRPPYTLEPQAWSDGRNVRFSQDGAEKMTGHQQVFGTPTVAPQYLLGVPTAGSYFWVYAGSAKVYTYDGATHTDITRSVGGDYTLDVSKPWNGGVFGDIVILNQPGDDPQYWQPISAGQPLQAFPAWPASTKAHVIKPYKNFLVALNLTQSGVDHPHKVKWSHSADPGSMPDSWDHTDATKDTGEQDVGNDVRSGVLLDQMVLRDANIIYKENAVYGMQFVGVGVSFNIFRFYQIFTEFGIMATHCVAPLGGIQHFVATGDDLVVHDGQQARSVIDRKLRQWLINAIDADNYRRSFCVENRRKSEAWFCFPEQGQTLPSQAIVYNWQNGAVGVRDLSDVAFIAPGVVVETEAVDTWDGGLDVSWDAGPDTPWGVRNFVPFNQRLVMADPTNTKLFMGDSTEQFDGADFEAYAERTGLALVGTSRTGEIIVDVAVRKLATRIWPRVTGGPVNIRVGAQESLESPVVWGDAQSFDPATQTYLDVCAQGKLLGVRFESTGNVGWTVHGYDLELENIGGL